MTRKQTFVVPDRAHSGRVALMNWRGQPAHRGHFGLINRAQQDCDTTILGFGSCQLSGVVRHPFTFEQRLEMTRTVVGDSFKPVQLHDIDSQVSSDDWADYCLDKIAKMNLPEPTDYYTGSEADAEWYINRFARPDHPHRTVGNVTTYTNPETGKRLHILDRTKTPFPAAEEIRSSIELRNTKWHDHVPERLVQYIDYHYPPHLRLPLKAKNFPGDVVVGTRVLLDGEKVPHVLHDDGKWRLERGV